MPMVMVGMRAIPCPRAETNPYVAVTQARPRSSVHLLYKDSCITVAVTSVSTYLVIAVPREKIRQPKSIAVLGPVHLEYMKKPFKPQH